MTYALTWLAAVLRDAGLNVQEESGWLTRGHGNFGTPLGVLCHHTAGPRQGNMPSLGTVIHGRPGLDGPLCNLALGRDGTWFVVAAGRAYHAGAGSWPGILNGNTSLIGIEAENAGYTQGPLCDVPWPAEQMASYARGCAALLLHCHLPVERCLGHKEWAPKRKVDPTFDMNEFRATVGAQMAELESERKAA